MLSVEIIDQMRREEERRREEQSPHLRVPLDRPLSEIPLQEETASPAEGVSTVVVVDFSHSSLEDFCIATW